MSKPRQCTVNAPQQWDACGMALWKQAEACADISDVRVKFDDDTEIKAHWCILLRCPHFRALHDSGLQEKTTGVINFDCVPADVGRLAFKFLYTGEIFVSVGQFSDLIKVADYWQMEALREACVSCLTESKYVVANDCLLFYTTAKKYKIDKLLKLAEEQMLANVSDFMTAENIDFLSAEFLKDMLKNPALVTIPRESLLKLITMWVEKSEENVKHFPELFSYLDLKEMPADALEKVKDNKVVLANPETKKRYEDHMLLVKSGKLDSCNTKEVILFTAQQSNDKDMKFHCYAYVIDENRWTQFAHLPKKLIFGSMAVVRDKVYACGLQDDADKYRYLENAYDEKMLMFELLQKNVKRKWNEVSFDNVDYLTHQVLECGSTKDGKLVTLRFCENNLVKLKIDQASYLKWCTEKGSEKKSSSLDKKAEVPEEQKTSQSYDLVVVPTGDYGRRDCISSHLVCSDEIVFVLIGFHGIMGMVHTEHCFVYHLGNKTLTKLDPPKSIMSPSIVSSSGKKVYLEKLGSHARFVFNCTSMKFTRDDKGIPDLDIKPEPMVQALVYHNGDLFLLALSGGQRTSVNTLYKLKRGSKSSWTGFSSRWVELSKFPLSPGLTDVKGIGWKVDKFKLRCPVDCRKCQFGLVTNWIEVSDPWSLYLCNGNVREPHQ